ncbi:hypothetical protein [Solicola sp. PLA-1-18]|uniref:hypothetical protein n=1 Tax=Solicola sp. PLA-1-18 TaxID=3380532 RepID=UPI003B7A7729
MSAPRHHRPAFLGEDFFDSLPGDDDPALRTAAGARVATLIVRGARTDDDQGLVDRVVRLTDEHGLDTLADLWAGSPTDSLSGVLWRLYVLRAWVRREPARASREFDAGRRFAPVDEVVAGVVDPPGPQEVAHLVDTVVAGVVSGDFADTLDRASAFARLVGVGRAHLSEDPPASVESAARLVATADVLRDAARLERAGSLT